MRATRRALLVVLLLLAGAGLAAAYGRSIYDLPVTLSDETGARVTFASWRGHRLAVTMGYTSCQRTCPVLTMKTLRRLEDRFRAAAESIELVVVTLDPKRDTPAVLAAYKRREGITSPHWHFLTGKVDDVERVARELGTVFVAPEQHIRHSFKIVVFDPRGEVEHTLDWDHRDVADVAPTRSR